MTGISAVAALATEVGILGVGLKTEQQSSVTIDIVQTTFASVCKIQRCATTVDAYREVKRDITNATGCMCVGSACCSVSVRRR